MPGPEWLIVLVVIVLLFGSSQLPKLARSLGQAKNEFEAGTKEGAREEDRDAAELEKSKKKGKS